MVAKTLVLPRIFHRSAKDQGNNDEEDYQSRIVTIWFTAWGIHQASR